MTAKNKDGLDFDEGDPRNETTGWSDISLDGKDEPEVEVEVEKPVKKVETVDPEDDEVEEDEQEEDEEPKELEAEEQPEVVEAADDEDEDEAEADPRPKKGQRAAKRIRKLVRERNEWQSAYATAQQAEQALRAEVARWQAKTAQLEDQTIAAHEARLDAEERQLKVAYKEALAEGDTDKQLAVNSDIARIAAHKQQLVGYKAVRANRQPLQNQGTQQAQPAQQPERRQLTDAERQAALNSLPKAAQDWYRNNQWFGKDQDLTLFAGHAGKAIETEGEVDPDSPEFWSELSRRVSVYKNGGKAPVKKTIRTPVAGGQRTGTQPKRPGAKVKLNAQERELAEAYGMTQEEWAAGKRKAGLA